MKDRVITGKWSDKTKTIQIKLPLIQFNEDGAKVVFCPALDLSGYGNNEKEALNSFSIVLSEFFKYTTNKNTFTNELIKLGWKVQKSKSMIAPEMSKLLESNKDFNRIFNTKPFKKIDKEISIPII